MKKILISIFVFSVINASNSFATGDENNSSNAGNEGEWVKVQSKIELVNENDNNSLVDAEWQGFEVIENGDPIKNEAKRQFERDACSKEALNWMVESYSCKMQKAYDKEEADRAKLAMANPFVKALRNIAVPGMEIANKTVEVSTKIIGESKEIYDRAINYVSSSAFADPIKVCNCISNFISYLPRKFAGYDRMIVSYEMNGKNFVIKNERDASVPIEMKDWKADAKLINENDKPFIDAGISNKSVDRDAHRMQKDYGKDDRTPFLIKLTKGAINTGTKIINESKKISSAFCEHAFEYVNSAYNKVVDYGRTMVSDATNKENSGIKKEKDPSVSIEMKDLQENVESINENYNPFISEIKKEKDPSVSIEMKGLQDNVESIDENYNPFIDAEEQGDNSEELSNSSSEGLSKIFADRDAHRM